MAAPKELTYVFVGGRFFRFASCMLIRAFRAAPESFFYFHEVIPRMFAFGASDVPEGLLMRFRFFAAS